MADALDLDSRDYPDDDYDGKTVGMALFRDALAAVRRRGRRRPVRRLSVHVESDYQTDFVRDIMGTSPGMDAVLAAPAVRRRLEELRIKLSSEFGVTWYTYVLPASRVPSRCLRVLELSGCTLGPPVDAVFGRLETVKVVTCIASPEGVQAMLDAAPALAVLWLERVMFTAEEDYDVVSKRRLHLRCPPATASVTVVHCHWSDGLYVDAPGAGALRYTGYLEHFPFGPQQAPVNLLQDVQLSFCTARRCSNRPSRETPLPPHAMFWDAIGRFGRLRVLKLELLDINDIAEEGDLRASFPELVFLELQGSHEVDSHRVAVAIANLLLCCPALQEFHFKCKLHEDLFRDPVINQLDERKARLALEKSMEALERLKSGKIIASRPSSVVGDGDADLAALKARSFPCLESHLRKIRLEFKLKSFDCFQIRLAKFLVENAHVLEEIQVHDGDQRVSDHIHHKLPIWRANSSKSKIKIVGV
ncbi:unnamed protein product [Urochloa humidicola]